MLFMHGASVRRAVEQRIRRKESFKRSVLFDESETEGTEENPGLSNQVPAVFFSSTQPRSLFPCLTDEIGVKN